MHGCETKASLNNRTWLVPGLGGAAREHFNSPGRLITQQNQVAQPVSWYKIVGEIAALLGRRSGGGRGTNAGFVPLLTGKRTGRFRPNPAAPLPDT